jgi:hypothetical protein
VQKQTCRQSEHGWPQSHMQELCNNTRGCRTAEARGEAPVLVGAGLVGGDGLEEGTHDGTLPAAAGGVRVVLAGDGGGGAPTAHGAGVVGVGAHARLAVLERRAVAAARGVHVPTAHGDVARSVGGHVVLGTVKALGGGRAPTAALNGGTLVARREVGAGDVGGHCDHLGFIGPHCASVKMVSNLLLIC